MDTNKTNDIIRELTRVKNSLLDIHLIMVEAKYSPEYPDIIYALHMQAKEIIRHLLLDLETEIYGKEAKHNVTQTMETHQKAPAIACTGLSQGQSPTGQGKSQGDPLTAQDTSILKGV